MDGAGRLARSLRSLRPQADLKAAAIGAVVLLRERLGLVRARRVKPRLQREQPNRLIAFLERYLPHRAGIAATVLLLLGSAGLGVVKGGHLEELDLGAQRHPQRDRQFRRIPHHRGRHQRPQAIDPGRGARDRRRQRPLVAAVPRRRHRARQAQGQSLDRRSHRAEVLSRPAPDRHRRTLGLRAVAAGWPPGGDFG